jgi:hypothetical protein
MRDCLRCRLLLMGISDCFSIVVLDGVMDSPLLFYYGFSSIVLLYPLLFRMYINFIHHACKVYYQKQPPKVEAMFFRI